MLVAVKALDQRYNCLYLQNMNIKGNEVSRIANNMCGKICHFTLCTRTFYYFFIFFSVYPREIIIYNSMILKWYSIRQTNNKRGWKDALYVGVRRISQVFFPSFIKFVFDVRSVVNRVNQLYRFHITYSRGAVDYSLLLCVSKWSRAGEYHEKIL
jgi:hypothetical protein